jgi:hypothetical protein
LTRVGLIALVVIAFPKQAAFGDLGALLARQPGVSARAHRFILGQPFVGAIHTATFSLPRPIGTGIPHPPVYALANFDPGDITRSIGAVFLGDPNAPVQFPTVNRKDKGDALEPRARAPMPPMPPLLSVPPMPPAEADAPFGHEDIPGLADDFAPVKPADAHAVSTNRLLGQDTVRVYFATAPLVSKQQEIRPWAPGYAPVVTGTDTGGETVANKGEVTGVDSHPQSPAARLKLAGKSRAKAEKCLANAVYFEARGEPVVGQIAVAQVVMNRVFSPFYPDKVCGVVYQNAWRHNACQFTFACDGVPDVVTEPDAWKRAERIAHDMLGGKLWLPQIAKSTHYHAYWVHPSWVHEMRKIDKIGVHTFYRPRAWGDGADEPSWSDPKTTARETKLIKAM